MQLLKLFVFLFFLESISAGYFYIFGFGNQKCTGTPTQIAQIQAFSGCYNDPATNISSSYNGEYLTIYLALNCQGPSYSLGSSCSMGYLLASNLPSGEYFYTLTYYGPTDVNCTGPNVPFSQSSVFPCPMLSSSFVMNQCLSFSYTNTTFEYQTTNSTTDIVYASGSFCNNSQSFLIPIENCAAVRNLNGIIINYGKTTVTTSSSSSSGSPANSSGVSLIPSSFMLFIFVWCLLLNVKPDVSL